MEVEVLQWFVSPGDRVSQFDKLCEVQSDKVNTCKSCTYLSSVDESSGLAIRGFP